MKTAEQQLLPANSSSLPDIMRACKILHLGASLRGWCLVKGLLAEGGSQLWLQATPSAVKGRESPGFLHFGVVFQESRV